MCVCLSVVSNYWFLNQLDDDNDDDKWSFNDGRAEKKREPSTEILFVVCFILLLFLELGFRWRMSIYINIWWQIKIKPTPDKNGPHCTRPRSLSLSLSRTLFLSPSFGLLLPVYRIVNDDDEPNGLKCWFIIFWPRQIQLSSMSIVSTGKFSSRLFVWLNWTRFLLPCFQGRKKFFL